MTNCLLTLTDDVIWAPSAGQCTIKLEDRGQRTEHPGVREQDLMCGKKNFKSLHVEENFRINYFVSQSALANKNSKRGVVEWGRGCVPWSDSQRDYFASRHPRNLAPSRTGDWSWSSWGAGGRRRPCPRRWSAWRPSSVGKTSNKNR